VTGLRHAAGPVAQEEELTGVLVVRAWKRVGTKLLRARITGRRDVLADEETSITVAGADRASEAVHDWLAAFEQDADSGPGAVTYP
jgi:hypothetical protein